MHAMPRVLGWPYPRRSNRPQLRRTKNSGSQAPTESVLPWTRADTVVLGAYSDVTAVSEKSAQLRAVWSAAGHR